MANKEQSETTSPTVEDFTEMPSNEDFGNLDSPLQEQLVEKFSAKETTTVEDQEDQDSKTSKETSSKEQISTDESTKDKTSESTKETEVDEQNKDKTTAHKELEAEFTRRSQRMKGLENENSGLKERLARLEGSVEGKTDKDKKGEESPLAQLKKKSPEAAPILDALEKVIQSEVEKRVDKRIESVEEQVNRRDENENLAAFEKATNEFLNSALGKEFEKEMNAIIDENFETKDQLLDAAKSDSQLFKKLEKEFVFKHQDKIFEFRSKQSEENPEKRNKEINDLGVSGKSKTGKTKSPDLMEIKEFNKLKTSDEMLKLLDQHGAVEKT